MRSPVQETVWPPEQGGRARIATMRRPSGSHSRLPLLLTRTGALQVIIRDNNVDQARKTVIREGLIAAPKAKPRFGGGPGRPGVASGGGSRAQV